MPAIDFPSNPGAGASYSFGGRTWAFNGTGWVLQPASSGIASYADAAALAAVGTMRDGDQAAVPSLGLYLYSAADAGLADGETLVAPVSGAGRWQLVAPAWDFVWGYLQDLLADSNAAIAALQPFTVRRAVSNFVIYIAGTTFVDFDVPGAQPGMQVVCTLASTWPAQIVVRPLVLSAGRVRLYASAVGSSGYYTVTGSLDLTLTKQFP